MIVNNKNYVIRQSSKVNPKKEGYFNWDIWIENGTKDISEIDYVEYLLHSTFKNRLKEKKDPSNGFLLQSSGWGEFEIQISINLKTGNTIQRVHWLTLGEDFINEPFEELEALEQDDDDALRKVYISYSAPDIKKAIYAQDLLSDLGIEVVSGMNMNLDNSMNDFIETSIEDSDLVVNINSGNETEWQKKEKIIANQLSKKIVTLDDNLNPKEMKDFLINKSKSSKDLYEENLKALKTKLKE